MTQVQVPELTLQDIQLSIEIIDLASTRGSIKGNEMYQVGSLRTRLIAFIDHQNSVAEAQRKEEAQRKVAQNVTDLGEPKAVAENPDPDPVAAPKPKRGHPLTKSSP